MVNTVSLSIGLLLLVATTFAASPKVVINEVHYHPSNDNDRLQYIELLNAGEGEVDLSGWKLRGVKFDLPNGTQIAPGGFLVIARDLKALQSVYGTDFPAIGDLGGRLKRSGEKLHLVDKDNQVIDGLEFSDEAPWPLGPDGYASSLERISPNAPGGDPQNWAPSRRSARKGREGTPGRANDNASLNPLPSLAELTWQKLPAPNKEIAVSATIKSPEEVTSAILEFYTFRAGSRTGQTNQLDLKRTSGSAQEGRYEAAIPPQPADTLVRFTVRVATAGGAERLFPSQYEPRPAFSSYIFTAPARARIPIVRVINPSRVRGSGNKMQPARDDLPEVGNSAFVYIPPEGDVQFFDFAQVRVRSGGWKVHFLKDQLLDGMSGINLISEGPPRWMLSEHLSYELFRRAGVRTQNSGHFRVEVDGRPFGYMLWVEQPNKTFLARSGRDNDGNLYKIRWFERDVAAAHEKKTNPGTGHADITSLIRDLNRLSGDAQYKFIQQNFDLTNVINYFAVNMCIQNWDGFFNNYYAYHDTKPGGKWEIIPWDEDKTWGDFDGASTDYDWYEMPLTTGMNGDRMARSFRGGRGPFGGGASWWRPAGWFSGPLLSNPQFRKVFLTRLKEICEMTFTEQKFGPVIESLHKKLGPEVAAGERAQFNHDIETFRQQLANRRKFILKEIAKQNL